MKKQYKYPEWLADELGFEFSMSLGSMHSVGPTARIHGSSQDYAAYRGLPDHTAAIANTGAVQCAISGCPHCGTMLNAASRPASGPCPSCDGSPELPVNIPRFWQRGAVWVSWLLTLLMIFIIVWGLILIEIRIGLGALNVESYDPVHDNRFESWPWSLRANQHCRISTESITGIGWDGRGGMHALVDPSFVVVTHNTPSENLRFADAAGKIHSRTVVSQHALSMDVGLPWIRLCRLNSPLPPSIRPLPILDLSGQRTIDLTLLLVGRHGRIGTEQAGSVEILSRTSHISGEPSSVGALVVSRVQVTQGDAKLRVGDSGTPLIAKVGNEWHLVGLANGTKKSPHSFGTPDMQIYALLSPQLRDMKHIGAEPSAVRLN